MYNIQQFGAKSIIYIKLLQLTFVVYIQPLGTKPILKVNIILRSYNQQIYTPISNTKLILVISYIQYLGIGPTFAIYILLSSKKLTFVVYTQLLVIRPIFIFYTQLLNSGLIYNLNFFINNNSTSENKYYQHQL